PHIISTRHITVSVLALVSRTSAPAKLQSRAEAEWQCWEPKNLLRMLAQQIVHLRVGKNVVIDTVIGRHAKRLICRIEIFIRQQQRRTTVRIVKNVLSSRRPTKIPVVCTYQRGRAY